VVAVDNATTSKVVGHNLVHFYATLFGASRIVAMCNVLAIEQGLGRIVGQRVEHAGAIGESSPEPNDTSTKDAEARKASDAADAIIGAAATSSSSPTPAPSSVPAKERAPPTATVDATAATTASVAGGDAKKRDDPATLVTDATPKATKVAEPISPTPVAPPTSNAPPAPDTPAKEGGKEPEMKEPPEVVLVPPADASHIHLEEDVPSGNGQKPFFAGQSGRESVWQKLANRIKVSLSSEYFFVLL
jgi:hypothetical protein